MKTKLNLKKTTAFNQMQSNLIFFKCGETKKIWSGFDFGSIRLLNGDFEYLSHPTKLNNTARSIIFWNNRELFSSKINDHQENENEKYGHQNKSQNNCNFTSSLCSRRTSRGDDKPIFYFLISPNSLLNSLCWTKSN